MRNSSPIRKKAANRDWSEIKRGCSSLLLSSEKETARWANPSIHSCEKKMNFIFLPFSLLLKTNHWCAAKSRTERAVYIKDHLHTRESCGSHFLLSHVFNKYLNVAEVDAEKRRWESEQGKILHSEKISNSRRPGRKELVKKQRKLSL